MVVPMFAPKMNKKAARNLITFLATRGTTKDVVMVLDRIKTVLINPVKNV